MKNQILKFIILFMTVLTVSNNVFSQQKITKFAKAQYFIENQGQWPSDVKFLAKVKGMNVWIKKSGIVYDFYNLVNKSNPQKKAKDILLSEKNDIDPVDITRKGHSINMQFKNTKKICNAIGLKVQPGFHNYFIGNDPSKWAKFVRLYKEVKIENLYNGIDTRIYFDNGSVRYDLIVAPGSDLSQIQIEFAGENNISVNEKGELGLETRFGKVEHRNLFAFQVNQGEKQKIQCSYSLLENGYITFKAGKYDKSKPVIIDPLVYSTFIGGSSTDYSFGISNDDSGNAYITGNTCSADYPTTIGSYDNDLNGNFDTFVSKINSSGTELIFSTYIGGATGWDRGDVVKIDQNGKVYIG